MQRQENPSSFRLTPEQLDRIHRESVESGIPRNRIVRLAIDAYFARPIGGLNAPFSAT